MQAAGATSVNGTLGVLLHLSQALVNQPLTVHTLCNRDRKIVFGFCGGDLTQYIYTQHREENRLFLLGSYSSPPVTMECFLALCLQLALRIINWSLWPTHAYTHLSLPVAFPFSASTEMVPVGKHHSFCVETSHSHGNQGTTSPLCTCKFETVSVDQTLKVAGFCML